MKIRHRPGPVRRGSTFGQRQWAIAPAPNLCLASQYLAHRCKNVLSPSKYAKMRFWPGLHPGARCWSSRGSPCPLVGWGGDIPPHSTFDSPHFDARSPLGAFGASAWRALHPKIFSYFCLELLLGPVNHKTKKNKLQTNNKLNRMPWESKVRPYFRGNGKEHGMAWWELQEWKATFPISHSQKTTYIIRRPVAEKNGTI